MSSAIPVVVTIGNWEQQRADAAPLRHAVFVEEQQVPVALELDEFDAVAEHAVARLGERAVGTARLLPNGRIGRMAVDARYRHAGVGSALLRALVGRARQRGDLVASLHAQVHARDFYARQGFVEQGEVFDDAGIPHVAMILHLVANR